MGSDHFVGWRHHAGHCQSICGAWTRAQRRLFCICAGCGTHAVRHGTWHSQAWLQCRRRTRCRRPTSPSDDRTGGCWTQIYRGWDLRLDGGSRNPPACPPRRRGQQGSDTPGSGLSCSVGSPLQQGAADGSAAPWPERDSRRRRRKPRSAGGHVRSRKLCSTVPGA